MTLTTTRKKPQARRRPIQRSASAARSNEIQLRCALEYIRDLTDGATPEQAAAICDEVRTAAAYALGDIDWPGETGTD